ncbi:MBL fold metallo-hydrolase [uncultured Clostridium sp.]|uniref:MBL fold metallo-hydrolase n=1 Tax=uncultured Clostridium sp. TaxID=59620 RepID=UPI00280B953D|nr:MBL fold metallo-hydrolase [uncultured Clostridium sp.]
MSIRKVNVKEITKKVFNKEKLFILDVRNPEEFKDWKIEGHNFNHLNVPYFDLLDGVESIEDKLPKNEEFLVVCAKEGSSLMIAEMLDEAGFKASYLEGGMKSYSEYLEPLKIADLKNGGELYQFVRIGKGCLSYMIISDGEAAIIDATRFINLYMDFANSKGAKIKHVFDTHLHADHISGGRFIAEKVGASYYLPPKDAEGVTFSYNPLEDGLEITVGNSSIKMNALYSPGHTIGSTSFIIDNSYLLSGDILFINSIGRPDLAGVAEAWGGDLRESLYNKYRKLSKDLLVLPAHFMIVDELNDDGSVGKKLGELFEKNHGLNIKDEEKFINMVSKNLPPQPNDYKDIRLANIGNIAPDEDRQREMEIGPNRCAVR